MTHTAKIIIAGPCAAESEEQMAIAIHEATKRNVTFVRTNLWKPRSRPTFDGLGEAGLPLLTKVAAAGLSPGLEVIIPRHVTLAMEAVLPHLHPGKKLLVWIGARNQNHLIQQEIAALVAQDPRVMLMVKNQPWVSEDHWEGIIEHVLSTGLAKENLLNCSRGFTPHGDNPLGLRNVPDFAMTARVKAKTGVPVIFDPSHTAGNVPNVFKMGEAAANEDIDGVIVEVHHDPEHALTDKTQQITWDQFDELMRVMKFNS